MSGLVLLAFTGGARGVRPGIDDAAKARGIVVVYESGCATPAYLLAVGPEGGAALARWVAEHGLDGVTGVGLVGLTAPWAERWASVQAPRCPKCFGERTRPDTDDCKHWICACGWAFTPRPLGPLEPLRGVAERARVGEPVERPLVCGVGPEPAGRYRGTRYPLSFVVACAPDDGVCGVCGGRAIVSIGAPWGRADATCAACVSGKALSSFDVACELLGRRIPDRQASDGDGGLEVRVWHPDDAARLVEFALPFVVERLTR